MTYRRNPCPLCGSYAHSEVECLRYEEHDTVAEAAVVRPAYVADPGFVAWLEERDRARAFGLPTAAELSAPHPLQRKAA